jgi:hypothetical protein
MTNAVWATPIHSREQVKCFGEMSEHDYHKAPCPQQLQEGDHSLCTGEKDCRTSKQHAHRNQREQGYVQCGVHRAQLPLTALTSLEIIRLLMRQDHIARLIVKRESRLDVNGCKTWRSQLRC